MTAVQKAPTYEAAETVTASESPRNALQRDYGWVSMLGAARSNGHRRHVKGLELFAARYTPVGGMFPGATIEIETAGAADLPYETRAELLRFAGDYFEAAP